MSETSGGIGVVVARSSGAETQPGDRGSHEPVAGVVVGWRSWNLAAEDGTQLLSPSGAGTVWPAHQPAIDDSGVHAARDAWDAIRDRGTVLGCVALWGEIVSEPRGWRATEAYPCLLIVGPEVTAADRQHLAAAYGVPVYRAEIAADDLTASTTFTERDRAALAERAEAVRASLAGTPPGAQPRDADASTPIEPLLARMRPPPAPTTSDRRTGRPGLRVSAGALLGMCLGPDLWAATVHAGWDPLPDDYKEWVFATLGCGMLLLFVTILASYESEALRRALGESLGDRGRRLWRVTLPLRVVAGAAQLVAVWELLADHDPAWLAALPAMPALVIVLGLTARRGGRPFRSSAGC